MASKRLNALIKFETQGNDKLKQSTKDVKELGKEIKNVGANFKYIASNIVSTMKIIDELTGYTDKYITSQKVLSQTFNNSTKSLNEYINRLSYMTGISETNISKTTAWFGQMATSLGADTEMAKDFSMALDTLSAKMSMLYNIDYEAAAKSLLDAVKGESSTLTSLTGIIVKTQSLQNTLNQVGLNVEASTLNGINLAMAEYITVANAINSTNKEMQETVNDVAWQKRVLTQQIQRLSNAFGNLLYPIVKAILPYLNAILIVLTEIINTVAKLVGWSGDVSTSVEGASTSFNNLEKSIQKASNASKGLRGFDKLNNITTPTSSTGAGGVGGVSPELYGAFEKASQQLLDIRNKAQDVAEKIMDWLGFTKDVNGEWEFNTIKLLKNIYNWWSKLNTLAKIFVSYGLVTIITKVVTQTAKLLKSLKTIVALKWANITNVISLVKEVGVNGIGGMLTDIERLAIGLVGVIATVDGIIRLAEAFKSIKENGANFDNVTDVIIGLTEAISGLAIVVGILTENWKLAVEGIVGLGIAIFGEMFKSATTTKDAISEVEQEVVNSAKTAQDSISSYENQLGAVKNLTEELEGLMDANGKVKKGSEERVEYILNQLNDAYGTEYKLVGNQITQNGKLVTSYNEIEKEIDKYLVTLKGQYAIQKYQDTINKALDSNNEKQEKLNAYEKEYKDVIQELRDQLSNKAIDQETYNQKVEKTNKLYDEQKSKIEKSYESSEQILEDYGKLSYAVATGNINDIDTYYNKLMEETSTKSDGYAKEAGKYFSGVFKEVENTSSEINKNVTGSLEKDMATSGKKAGESWKSAFKDAVNSKGGIQISSSTSTGGTTKITTRASGGFLTSGEMYIARENGLSEMIGRIGSKGAVANNDQITDGIASAVYKANMASQKGNKADKVEIIAEGDASGLLQFITFKQKENERQFGF